MLLFTFYVCLLFLLFVYNFCYLFIPTGIPEDVRTVFGFLMDSRPLSVMEYDKLIKYLANISFSPFKFV